MNTWRLSFILVLVWMLISAIPSLAATETVTIGLRFIVSKELGQSTEQRRDTETILKQYVSGLNDIYRNSKIMLRGEIKDIHYAKIEPVDARQILQEMAREQNGFASLFRQANEFGADYTIAVVPKLEIRGKARCGRAFAVNQTIEEISSTRRAFAVINIHPACGAQTLAHELGHLMGLNHGTLVDSCLPNQGHTSALTPYAKTGMAGGTAMVYANQGSSGRSWSVGI